MKSPAILIAEEDEILRQDMKGLFILHGLEAIEAPSQTDILPFFLDTKPDLVIIRSSRNSTWDELKVTEQIHKRDRNVALILITTYSSEWRAIATLREGINDYFKTPFWNRDHSIGAKIRGEERRKDTSNREL